MKNCLICGKPDHEKPMCFRGDPWCCNRHRKAILAHPAFGRWHR